MTSSKRIAAVAITAWVLICGASLGRGAFLYYRLHGRHVGLYPMLEKTGQAWLHSGNLYPRTAALNTFRASPLLAAILAPISLLPNNIGSVIVRAVSLWLYLLGLHRWMRHGWPEPPGPGGVALIYLLVIPLSIMTLLDVQTTGAAIGLLLLAAADAATSRWWRASMCTALAVMLKAYPISFGLILALLYPRRFAPRFAAALLILLAIPFVLQRPAYVAGQYRQWIDNGLDTRKGMINVSGPASQPMEIQIAPYCDVRVILAKANIDVSAAGYVRLQVLAGAAIAMACAVLRWRGMERRRLIFLVLGWTCCWMTAFGPATEAQGYIFIAPSVAAVVLLIFESRSSVLRIAAVVVWTLGLLSQFPHLIPDAVLPAGKRFTDVVPHAVTALILVPLLAAASRLWCDRETQMGLSSKSP